MAPFDMLDRAVVAHIPAIVKAQPDSSGRRIVSVTASTEQRDLDGDVVLQKSLLDAAPGFIASGHLDIDHISELGSRMNPPVNDPASYIVGRPIDVTKGAGDRTIVMGELSRSMDGSFDPARSRADELWASLTREPPVQWYASIYGFPTDLDDWRRGGCPTGIDASRFVIKAIDWRSLAFTRSPKNTALVGDKGAATKVVMAKSWMANLVKADPPMTAELAIPRTMWDVWKALECPACRVHEAPTLVGARHHFAKCLGQPNGTADILAHAAMHKHMVKSILTQYGLG